MNPAFALSCYLFSLFFVLVLCVDDANLPPYELSALQDLYDATDGPNWVLGYPSAVVWNFSADANPCVENWQGITCGPLIPPSIYRHVLELELQLLNLHGTLPSSIGNLTKLESLNVQENYLRGSIPASIGIGMPRLIYLLLAFNYMSGTIPNSIYTLSSLKELVLGVNNLNGTLSSDVNNMLALTHLGLNVNLFSGTIPETLANLPQLTFINLFSNYFEGAFPDSLQNQYSLQTVDLSDNLLSGTLSNSLCHMTNLTFFSTAFNSFTGTIPNCIGNWSQLTTLNLYENGFTGTLPNVLGTLANLTSFWVFVNFFTGTIPASMGQLTHLKEFFASNNYLTQTIPPSLGNLTSMTELYLQTNLLTGTIPAELGGAVSLRLVYLEDNMFTGTVPPIFSGFLQLRELILQSNRFHGRITEIFTQAPHSTLEVVQLSENQFSGSLPEALYDFPHLQTFAASVNCITGTIPAGLCNSTRLTTLVLDGLQSASTCRISLLPSAHTYTVPNNAHGTIPSCLFTDLPKLYALHLAGNGHTGTLPGNVHISAALVDLAVSHNILSGTIPHTFQHRAWSNLDLSYNRLTGGLDPEFQVLASLNVVDLGNTSYNTTGVTYALQNNRLSGRIPAALIAFTNVSMLGSNLFFCKVDKHDLPKSDPDYHTYQCASNSFDNAYYAFLILVGGIAVVLLFLLYGMSWSDPFSWKKSLLRALEDWDLEREVSLRHVNFVRSVSDILCQIGVSCTAIILVVLVPWYVVGSHYYGTYTHEYAWTVSAAFMSGLTPGLIDLFLYFFMASFVAASAVYIVVRTDRARQRASSRLSGRTSASSIVSISSSVGATEVVTPLHWRLAYYAGFLSINLIVVVGMNVAFVTVALTQDNFLLLVAQIVLSSFKLLWNTVCTPYLISLTLSGISHAHQGAGFVTVQVLVALFNNITIPCLVVAVVSPSCFYSVFDSAPNVESSFVYQVTLLPETSLDRQAFVKLTDYISYRPPFKYDYQCSSSFITYYAPAFVYLGIAASVVTPLAHVIGLHWYKRASPGTVWFKLLSMTLPTILKPLRPENPRRRVFDANIHVISLITYLGILLTFGVVYPPLAVAMCATMFSVTWQARLEIGRYLHYARESGNQRFVDILERNCKGTASLQKLRRSLFIIVCFCCAFYALFVFDTLGNAVGLTDALWSVVVMPLFPVCIAAVVRLRAYAVQRGMGGGNGDSMGFSVDENVFEMHTRRAGGSISSGMSEVAMSDMDSLSRSRTTSVSSVGSARSSRVSEVVRDRQDFSASAQGRSRQPSAVFNALQAPAMSANVEDP